MTLPPHYERLCSYEFKFTSGTSNYVHNALAIQDEFRGWFLKEKPALEQ
jgi:hypothetical protein